MTYSLTVQNPYDEIDYSPLDNANLAPSTKIKYRKIWERALVEGVKLSDLNSVMEFAKSLSPSYRLQFRSMMKIMTTAAEDQLKNSVNPDTVTVQEVARMQAIIWRLEGLRKSIKTKKQKGKKLHLWLSQEQVNEITALPFRRTDISYTRQFRDYIVLATLLGAGPRREEMNRLKFSAVRTVTVEGKKKDVLEIHEGKGNKSRVVLISPILAKHIREWEAYAGGEYIARPVNKGNKIANKDLSVIGIWNLVRQYGALIGLPTLDPHDCRRSFGRLVYEETHDIKLVRDLLGHVDLETTMIYIDLELNLDQDASKFVIREDSKLFYMPVSGD